MFVLGLGVEQRHSDFTEDVDQKDVQRNPNPGLRGVPHDLVPDGSVVAVDPQECLAVPVEELVEGVHTRCVRVRYC